MKNMKPAHETVESSNEDYAVPIGNGNWEVKLGGKSAWGRFGDSTEIRKRIDQLKLELARAELVEAAKDRHARGPELDEMVRVSVGQADEYVGIVTQIDDRGKVLVEGPTPLRERWYYFSETAPMMISSAEFYQERG